MRILPFILIIICILPHCKKEKECCPTVLPPISESGKNVFGCRVNGEVWVPFYKCSFRRVSCADEKIVGISNNNGVEITIIMRQKKADGSQTSFHIASPTGSTIHTTGNKIDSLMISYQIETISYYYSKNNNRPEHFTITKLDTLNKIISGIFELTLYRSIDDSVHVTEGRFDFKYSQ